MERGGNAGGGFRTRDLQIMSLAYGGLGLAPQTGTLTRLSYPGTARLHDGREIKPFFLGMPRMSQAGNCRPPEPVAHSRRHPGSMCPSGWPVTIWGRRQAARQHEYGPAGENLPMSTCRIPPVAPGDSVASGAVCALRRNTKSVLYNMQAVAGSPWRSDVPGIIIRVCTENYTDAFIFAQDGFSSITQRNFFCRVAVYIFSHCAPISSVHALKTRGSI